MDTIKSTGYIPSPNDHRDFLLSNIQGPIAIPDFFIPYVPLPIYHQHKQPSCTAHATAWMVNYNEYTEGEGTPTLSPRFIYALSKRDDGIPDTDGTYYRQALKEALKYGICRNDLFPNDTDLPRAEYNDASHIPQTAYDDADIRRIKSYAHVDNLTFDGLKQAIWRNGAVLLGLEVGDNFYTDTFGNASWAEKDILPLRPPLVVQSGHAVVAWGYDKQYIYFANSWGPTWGRNGMGYFGPDYIPHVQEAWTTVDLSDAEIIKQKKLMEAQIGILQRIIALYKQLRGIK